MNIPRQYSKIFYIFLLIVIIVYFPILFNGFVWDDFPFIIENPEIHQPNILKLLGRNMFNSGPFYRPIPAIYFASAFSMFGEQAFFYHASQLILHLIGTCLLFLFFRRFFSTGISFFLALIFLVHPINVESVAYIGSTQSELYFLPGIAALLLSLKQNLSRTRLLYIAFLLFAACMAKETGFLFILLVILNRYLFKIDQIKKLVFVSAVIIVIYALLRVFIGGVTYRLVEEIPIANLSLTERILSMPAIISYYLKTFMFPLNLAIWQIWVIKSPRFADFGLPFILSGIFLITCLITIYILHKSDRETYMQGNKLKKPKIEVDKLAPKFTFFLLWFVLGLGMILQFVPLDMTVADRWFYFPIVGLLGMIGVGLHFLQHKHKVRGKVGFIIIVIIISLLTVRTFVRTLDYKDNLTLYGHDVNGSPKQYLLMMSFAQELKKSGRIEEALRYASSSVSVLPTVNNLNTLGTVYLDKKQYQQAISAFTLALKTYKSLPKHRVQGSPGMVTRVNTHLHATVSNLALTYVILNRPHDVIKVIKEEGLPLYPTSSILYYHLAFAEAMLNNYDEALNAATKSFELAPNAKNAQLLNAIKTYPYKDKSSNELIAPVATPSSTTLLKDK
jgi:hypothetical protein